MSLHHPFPIIPTVASFIGAQAMGALWYSPLLFGNKWMEVMKKKDPTFAPEKEDQTMTMVGAAAMWLASSICFTTMVGFWKPQGGGSKHELLDLLCMAHTAWLGFTVPQNVFSTIFHEEDKVITTIGAGYSFVAYTWMALAHFWL